MQTSDEDGPLVHQLRRIPTRNGRAPEPGRWTYRRNMLLFVIIDPSWSALVPKGSPVLLYVALAGTQLNLSPNVEQGAKLKLRSRKVQGHSCYSAEPDQICELHHAILGDRILQLEPRSETPPRSTASAVHDALKLSVRLNRQYRPRNGLLHTSSHYIQKHNPSGTSSKPSLFE